MLAQHKQQQQQQKWHKLNNGLNVGTTASKSKLYDLHHGEQQQRNLSGMRGQARL
jgi:hypothetical protein